MTEQEIQIAVLGILRNIAPEIEAGQIPAEAPLRETLDIDSFDYLRFITELHHKFQVEIPESDYRQLTTMRGVVGYLSTRTK